MASRQSATDTPWAPPCRGPAQSRLWVKKGRAASVERRQTARSLLCAARKGASPGLRRRTDYAAMLMLWDSWIPSIRSFRLCIAWRCSTLPKRSANVRSTTWPAFP
jgi:hypothetical protein